MNLFRDLYPLELEARLSLYYFPKGYSYQMDLSQLKTSCGGYHLGFRSPQNTHFVKDYPRNIPALFVVKFFGNIGFELFKSIFLIGSCV